jgi:alpha-L-fucosidase
VALDGVQGDHQLVGDRLVGPAGGQQPQHLEPGAWLDRNGDAIYATRPWTTAATTTTAGQRVRFTNKDRTVYAIVLADQLADGLTIRDLRPPAGSRIGVLNMTAERAWSQEASGVRIESPPRSPGRHAQVLTITTP